MPFTQCYLGLASKESVLLIGLALVLIVRTGLDIWFSSFNGRVVRAIVSKDWKLFTTNAVVLFAIMMWPMSIVNNSIKLIINHLTLSFRKRLTHYAHDQYLHKLTFYKVTNLDNRIQNVDQLLTQDIVKFSDSLSHLYTDITKPLVDVGLFALKLGQSLGAEAPLLMLSYFLSSGYILRYISPPFARFTAKEQSLEGEFRYAHSRIISHSEEIAFYRGAEREKAFLNGAFNKILEHLNHVFLLKFGNGIIDSVLVKYCATQLAYFILSRPVFSEAPITAVAAEIDSTKIMEDYSRNSGYLINLSQAVGRLVLAGRDLTRFSGYTWRLAQLFTVLEDVDQGRYQRSMLNELGGINDVRTVVEKELAGTIVVMDGAIEFDHVPIATPSGDVLVRDMTFQVHRGMNCLITGPNGSGKSSLFRVLGELWPLFSGKMSKPSMEEMFYVPQRPYLPLGTLRDQLIYPMAGEDFAVSGRTDRDLDELLKIVHLEYLQSREGSAGLDAVRDWNDVLSGGEKQRIAMARLFFHRPQFAILDECTSAVSIDVEGLLYQYAQSTLGITLFTVSHRPSLFKFHEYLLRFDGNGGYEFVKLDLHPDNSAAGKGLSLTGQVLAASGEAPADNEILAFKPAHNVGLNNHKHRRSTSLGSATVSADSPPIPRPSTPTLVYAYPQSPHKANGGTANEAGNETAIAEEDDSQSTQGSARSRSHTSQDNLLSPSRTGSSASLCE